MAYASRLYPRAKPRGFTLQWIKPVIRQVFFVCEKSRTFARSEEEETTDRHERAKTADFEAELILSIE